VITLEVTLFKGYEHKLDILTLILYGFSKGIFCNNKFTLQQTKKITIDQSGQDKQECYELIMINDDHTVFANFDTKGLSFIIPPENIDRYFGKPFLTNALANSYYTSQPNIANHYRIIAKYQTRYSFPVKIKKTNRLDISTLSKASYENNYMDFQEASIRLKRELDTDSVDSCIFTANKVSVGTGYYRAYYDPGFLFLATKKIDEDVNENNDVIKW